MQRPSVSDIAFLARLMTEGEIARASLPDTEQRTARRLVEAHLIFQYEVQPTRAMQHDGLTHVLVVYHLNASATRTLCRSELLSAVLVRLPGFLDARKDTATGLAFLQWLIVRSLLPVVCAHLHRLPQQLLCRREAAGLDVDVSPAQWLPLGLALAKAAVPPREVAFDQCGDECFQVLLAARELHELDDELVVAVHLIHVLVVVIRRARPIVHRGCSCPGSLVCLLLSVLSSTRRGKLIRRNA
jgi:hypothetical protein